MERNDFSSKLQELFELKVNKMEIKFRNDIDEIEHMKYDYYDNILKKCNQI
jgi:hypothetical protein